MSDTEGLVPIDDSREEGGEDIAALRRLKRLSPDDTFTRLRRRAAVVQGTRLLFESQVTGFWTVLDALLRLLLGGRPAVKANPVHGEEV